MNIPSLNRILPITAGLFYGITYAAGSFDSTTAFQSSFLLNEGVAISCFLPFLLYFIQRILNEILLPLFVDSERQASFYSQEKFSYLVFLIPLVLGVRPQFAQVWVLISIILLLQAGLFIFNMKPVLRKELTSSHSYIAFLFLISGFSALIYQVVWQRVLFTTFGTNSEAVTVIVSVFMFGLGIGAIGGGFLQRKFNQYLLQIFIVIEVCIGIFGLLSLSIIQKVSIWAAHGSVLELTGWVYLILSFPTLLMGASLPILVAYLQKYFSNLGKSVGLLYAFNTLGSAIAAFFTVEVLFVFFGQSSTLIIASFFNFITALLIFLSGQSFNVPAKKNNSSLDSIRVDGDSSLPYKVVFFCLIVLGYISLSQEILWFRLLGILTGGKPQVFGMLLAAFLLGIAGGSFKAKKICEGSADVYNYVLRALFLATIIFYLATPSVSFIAALINKPAGVLFCYILIGLLGYFMGGLLPIFIHKSISQQRQDSAFSMSWLYFANILGATSGPLVTGFLLLEFFTLEQNILFLTSLSTLFLLYLTFIVPVEFGLKRKIFFGVAVFCVVAAGAHQFIFFQYFERLQFGDFNVIPFKYRVENRAGVITVEKNKSDLIYGGGVYDGRFNINPLFDSNLITRAYMIAALHRNPERVLEIGLSSGSWTRVMLSYESIKNISVVEINKGYIDVIRHYPEIAEILTAPKVSISTDDGRRWLRNHPGEKFNLIVMNTTLYWRSNATNLLSREFLEMCRDHLLEGGVLYYNNTGSDDVTFTATHVFRYVTTYQNFVAASDAPFNLTQEERRNNFLRFKKADGTLLFSQISFSELLDKFIDYKFLDWRENINCNKNRQLITDDNMAVEYKQREVIF